MDNINIIEDIKETLDKYDDEVPMGHYLLIVKEFKRVCNNFDNLREKETARNHKFMEVKRTLLLENQDISKKHSLEVSDLKREVLKYKSQVLDKDNENSKNGNVSIEDEIAKIIEEHFNSHKIIAILDEVVINLLSGNFTFEKITLSMFDSHKITFLQRVIYKVVMVTIESNSTTIISAVTNAILRKSFAYIHEKFAIKLLEASNVERGVFKFFETYTVEEDSGTRWNSFAITRFMSEYIQNNLMIEKIRLSLEKHRVVLSKMDKIDDDSEMDFAKHNNLMVERKKVEKAIHLYKLKLSEEEKQLEQKQVKYNNLLKATTKLLLQKRRVFSK